MLYIYIYIYMAEATAKPIKEKRNLWKIIDIHNFCDWINKMSHDRLNNIFNLQSILDPNYKIIITEIKCIKKSFDLRITMQLRYKKEQILEQFHISVHTPDSKVNQTHISFDTPLGTQKEKTDFLTLFFENNEKTKNIVKVNVENLEIFDKFISEKIYFDTKNRLDNVDDIDDVDDVDVVDNVDEEFKEMIQQYKKMHTQKQDIKYRSVNKSNESKENKENKESKESKENKKTKAQIKYIFTNIIPQGFSNIINEYINNEYSKIEIELKKAIIELNKAIIELKKVNITNEKDKTDFRKIQYEQALENVERIKKVLDEFHRSKYIKKYLKYKIKYLELKNKLKNKLKNQL